MTQAFVKPHKGVPIEPDALDLDEDSMYICAAFDPGGTTGWAVFGVHIDAIEDPECRVMDNIEFWSAGQFIGSEESQSRQMWELVEAWPSAKIVIEDFVLRKFTSARDLLSPVRITARFEERLVCMGDSRPMIKQSGNFALTTFTDDRLKRLGFYGPLVGMEHARDAVRHDLLWLKRAKKLHEQNMIVNAFVGAEA